MLRFHWLFLSIGIFTSGFWWGVGDVFAQITRTDFTINGGTGTFTCSPVPTSTTPGCEGTGTTCYGWPTTVTSVTCTATPANENTSIEWGWDASSCGFDRTCVIALNPWKGISTTWRQGPKLQILLAGTGKGTVTGPVVGIECDRPGGIHCIGIGSNGWTVPLTATPALGSAFAGWSGACTGTGGCSVVLVNMATTTVTATFNATGAENQSCGAPVCYLNIDVFGQGTVKGGLTGSPDDFNCTDGKESTTYCSRAVANGVVTFTAYPPAGSRFVKWEGACEESTNLVCSFTHAGFREVKAHFSSQIPDAAAIYFFNEGSGTITMDASGKGNNGSLSGANWITGKYGKGLSFNGVSTSNVSVPNDPSLNPSLGMTVEAWVFPTTSDNVWRGAVFKNDVGGLGYALYAFSTNNGLPAFGVSLLGQADKFVYGISKLPINAWTHIAGTYDGVNLRFYQNGVLASTVNAPGTLAPSTGTLSIGCPQSIANQCFKGGLDGVMIREGARTQAQIQQDMAQQQ